MEENNPQIQASIKPDPAFQTDLPTTNPISVETKARKPSFKVLLLFIVLVIMCAGYFGFQHYVRLNQDTFTTLPIPTLTSSPINDGLPSYPSIIMSPSSTPKPNCNLNAKQGITADRKYNTFESGVCGFSFSYPIGWNLVFYEDNHGLAISDLVNPLGADPDSIKGHSLVQIDIMPGQAESDFPYDNGMEKGTNNTIQPFTINGYTGIRGKQNSMFGIQDVVYLQGSNQTWASIVSSTNDIMTVNQILSSFKFIEKNIISDKWQEYSNNSYMFSIKYPVGWRKVESIHAVGFGPMEIGEDITWSVGFYDTTDKTIPMIKTEIGNQFSDRKQTEEAKTVNGLPAIKLVTTTGQYPDWYSVYILIQSGTKIFTIGNGAQTDEELNNMILKRTGKRFDITFEDFYSTFNLIN